MNELFLASDPCFLFWGRRSLSPLGTVSRADMVWTDAMLHGGAPGASCTAGGTATTTSSRSSAAGTTNDSSLWGKIEG